MTVEVIQKIRFADYVAIDAVNASRLKWAIRSLLYCKHRETEDKDTRSMLIGRAADCQLLTPDLYEARYIVWPGRRAGREYELFANEAEANGQEILTPAEELAADGIAAAAKRHAIVKRYLDAPGMTQVCIVWEQDGIRRKALIDKLCFASARSKKATAVADLKTTKSLETFNADAARYGYHLQLAWYADAVAAAGFGAPPCKLLAIENTEPHDAAVFDVGEAELDAGRDLAAHAVELYDEARRLDKWPGVAEDRELSLTLPTWAMPARERADYTGV